MKKLKEVDHGNHSIRSCRRADGELKSRQKNLKVTNCLHLAWKSGFAVRSQKGVVDNIFLCINMFSKPVTNHPQSRCEDELVREKTKIGQQLHDVSFENLLPVSLAKLCKTLSTFDIKLISV